jgi:hypothetical protein
MNWCGYANMFIWWLVIGLDMMRYDEIWWDMMRCPILWTDVITGRIFQWNMSIFSKMGCRYVTFTMRIPKFLERPFVARNWPMNIPYHIRLGFTMTLGTVYSRCLNTHSHSWYQENTHTHINFGIVHSWVDCIISTTASFRPIECQKLTETNPSTHHSKQTIQ